MTATVKDHQPGVGWLVNEKFTGTKQNKTQNICCGWLVVHHYAFFFFKLADEYSTKSFHDRMNNKKAPNSQINSIHSESNFCY